MWVPLTHAYVSEVAYDTEHFTSRGVVVSRGTMDDFPEGPIGGAPPITSDPPFHHHARRILLPPFSPKAIERWEPEIRRLCADLAGAIVTARRHRLRCFVALRPAHSRRCNRPHARPAAGGR